MIQSKWGSGILLSESREQGISNRSDVSDSKDTKATFVKGVVSHIAELCPGRCNWSKAACPRLTAAAKQQTSHLVLLILDSDSYLGRLQAWR